MSQSNHFMNRRFLLSSLYLFLILGGAFHLLSLGEASASAQVNGKTLVLYEAESGTIPGTPLMSFTDFPPGAALPIFSNDATIMDTTASGADTYAGWTANDAITRGFPTLDRMAGFQVDFTLQIENESHNNNNRSGFSLIILSDDAKGLELAFWENEIWTQSDGSTGGLFKHGEGVAFPTTGLVNYRLTVLGDTYTLTADTQSILTGPIRDYSEFDGFPNPYRTPNFLFLGDDTTSAQARIRLSYLSITGTEPILPTEASTVTSTSSPPPTASFTAHPSETPVPSPTPASRGSGLCPSGWILLAVVIPSTMMLRKLRRGAAN
jgi:hypothetical protein